MVGRVMIFIIDCVMINSLRTTALRATLKVKSVPKE